MCEDIVTRKSISQTFSYNVSSLENKNLKTNTENENKLKELRDTHRKEKEALDAKQSKHLKHLKANNNQKLKDFQMQLYNDLKIQRLNDTIERSKLNLKITNEVNELNKSIRDTNTHFYIDPKMDSIFNKNKAFYLN